MWVIKVLKFDSIWIEVGLLHSKQNCMQKRLINNINGILAFFSHLPTAHKKEMIIQIKMSFLNESQTSNGKLKKIWLQAFGVKLIKKPTQFFSNPKSHKTGINTTTCSNCNAFIVRAHERM